MKDIEYIKHKLTQFTKRYYINELIKGVLLFSAIGLLYFLVTVCIEYFLWLSITYRTVLFWIFIGVELSLFYKFIGIPLFQLFGLRKGISHTDASELIGQYFPEVNDKLTNLLQLQNTTAQSELLLASINQKAIELSPIPFKIAVNFKKNKKYLKYALLPIFIFLVFQITGNQNIIFSSYNRVVNHNIAYAPPAPFNFVIKNKVLQGYENQPFILKVTTKGSVIPEDLKINFNGESYYFKHTGFNSFEYEFLQLKESLEFQMSANGIFSNPYKIEVIQVPSILNLETQLKYPSHTGKTDAILFNTGNVTVPEGTTINLKIKTQTTDQIDFVTKDSSWSFKKDGVLFNYKNSFYKTTNYQIVTSNSSVTNYEQLKYTIKTIKDAYPEIKVASKADSLNSQIIYFLGKISDDYGLRNLQLVYKKANNQKLHYQSIPISKSNIQQFTFEFPGTLQLEKGITYEYYFQVSDNDGLHNFKTSKSQVFNYQKLTDAELEDKLVKVQKETISNLSKSLENLTDQKQDLKNLNQLQKEKKELNWNDNNKIKDFFKKQAQQDQLMKQFNKDLQRNLEEFQKDKITEDPFKDALKERLQTQEKAIEKNKELLKELEDLQDKLKNEELFSKLEQLSKETKTQERSLEQILELTKRYYVSKKFEKLANKIEELSKKQEQLSKSQDSVNNKEKQDSLNNNFKDLKDELNTLKNDNDALKGPMDLDTDKELEESISKEQQKASDNLEKQKQQKAKENQKKAAQQMKEMSMQMKESMQSSSDEQLEEDEKTLRQILDNLITYSFDQESLLFDFKNIHNNRYEFPNKLRQQYILKDHFSHIDDSLFALSLRVPKISDVIMKELTDTHFNIDKALERFADQQIYLGVSNQQYALTSANTLANLLSDILKSIQDQLQQQSKPGSGQCDKPGGTGQSFQLPDIIKKQGDLMEQMNDGKSGKKGESGKPKPGENGKAGDSNSDQENSSGELFEIYKQQQVIKTALQALIKRAGLTGKVNNLVRKMDEVQNDLLEKGFNQDTFNKMRNLQHELLKLDKAAFEQGEDSKRESNSNNNPFINTTSKKIPSIEQYFNEIEILNRQALPLQPIYKKKVQQYFKITDD